MITVRRTGLQRYTEISAGYDFFRASAAEVAACPGAGGEKLPGTERVGRAARVAHSVRERRVSQRWRMLESADGHVHDSGKRLHAPLRILRGAKRRSLSR